MEESPSFIASLAPTLTFIRWTFPSHGTPYADVAISLEQQEKINDRVIAAITFRGFGGQFER
jgi:hypothetical protein